MNRYVSAMTALSVTLAIGSIGRPAVAQSGMMAMMGYQSKPTPSAQRPSRNAAHTPPVKRVQYETHPGASVDGYPQQQFENYPGSSGGSSPDGCCDGGCCDSGYCDDGCYGGCGCDDGYGCESNCGGSWWDVCDCCDLAGGARPRRWFFTGDYLNVREIYSDAVAYLDQNDNFANQGLGTDTFHQLNFRRESSYRIGGGYELCNCGEQLRFMFTRLNSSADEQQAFLGDFIPYEVTPTPDGVTLINGGVDAKIYDLEYAKTIPLGGSNCNSCQCGDRCGCGDGYGCCDDGGCSSACPAWDITWSGGVRFADLDWGRTFVAVDEDGAVTTGVSSQFNFEGGGPRVGLEGRRYFGQSGWCSMYLRGDISVLLGHVDHVATRVVEGGTAPDITTVQSNHVRNVIPVTDIEAGLSACLTSSSSASIGYLFSAWHDLGMRDQFAFPTFMETNYDDANILGFDGFFARWEFAY